MKKNQKRRAAAFLAAVIILNSMLAGCGDKSSNSSFASSESVSSAASEASSITYSTSSDINSSMDESRSRITEESSSKNASSKANDSSSHNSSSKNTSSKVKNSSSKNTSSKVENNSSKAKESSSRNASSNAAGSSNSAVNTSSASQITTQPVTQTVEWYEPVYTEPEPTVEYTVYEKYDEDGNLLIDTDTLNGQKAAAITFDDGPSEYTRELIEGLNKRGAHATFFLIGSNVEKYPDVLQLMIDGGHQIGNHTYSHPVMTYLGEYYWRNEIDVTDNLIQNACGQTATAFRPPYGSYSNYMAATVDKTFTIWSVDTLDWQSRNFYSVRSRILSDTTDGSIILLHDLYKTSVDAALAAIDVLQDEGYVFVTVDELLTRYGYPISSTAHFSQVPFSETVPAPKPVDSDSVIDTSTDTESESETDTDTELTEPIESDIDTEIIKPIESDIDTNSFYATDSDEDSEITGDSTDTDLLSDSELILDTEFTVNDNTDSIPETDE